MPENGRKIALCSGSTFELQMKLTRRQFNIAGAAALAGAAQPFGMASAFADGRRVHDYGPNRLDWYPANNGASNAPVLIYVHGGAWRLGNKTQVGSKAAYFTGQGFHVASVGYTLYPFANVETQALQVGHAVNWVHANAAKLDADRNRIALMGHSAGCHLSALATLGGATEHVRALVCNDTRAYDIPALARLNGGSLPWLYASPFRKRKMWDAWSPVSYAGLKEQPPTLVAWSGGTDRDRLSISFADALEYDGTSVTRFDGRGKYNHVSIDRRMGAERGGLTEAANRFLQEKLA